MLLLTFFSEVKVKTGTSNFGIKYGFRQNWSWRPGTDLHSLTAGFIVIIIMEDNGSCRYCEWT